jgi:hypothetical protein
VTIQTLHPTLFDHGIIISRTPLPGIPVTPSATVRQLSEILAEEGARLLTNVVARQEFVAPVSPLAPLAHEDFVYLTGGQGLSKARKLKKKDSAVDWEIDSTDTVLCKLRVFGRVWDSTGAGVLPKSRHGVTRVFYDKAQELRYDDAEALRKVWRDERINEPPTGRAFAFSLGKTRAPMRVAIKMSDGRLVEILSCSAGGRPGQQKTTPGNYGIGLISGWIQNMEHNSED